MPDTFFLPFWIYFLPSPPCLWPLWDGLGTTSTGPLTFCLPVGINIWEALEGDGWKETEWDPWTYSPGSLLLNFPRYNHSFFKVSSSAGLCLSSTDASFFHFFGSSLKATHLIATNSHNLITLSNIVFSVYCLICFFSKCYNLFLHIKTLNLKKHDYQVQGNTTSSQPVNDGGKKPEHSFARNRSFSEAN